MHARRAEVTAQNSKKTPDFQPKNSALRGVFLAAVVLPTCFGCAVGDGRVSPEPRSNSQAIAPASGAPTPSNSREGLAAFTDSVHSGWRKATQWSRDRKAPDEWNWMTGIPSGIPRAELIPATVPVQSLARFAPQAPFAVSQASTSAANSSFVIERVGEQPIKNLADLAVAVEDAVESGVSSVVVRRTGTPGTREPGLINIDPGGLTALAQASGPEHTLVRTVYAGSPAVMIRQHGVSCIVTARVERQRGVLQAMLVMRQHWGERAILPREITATCDETPLRCLSLPETLELLYGDFDSRVPAESAEVTSFAAVSERDDYLIPFNYRHLQTQLDEQGSFAKRPRPALIELPDMEYPGPAILGDARAMVDFLLQREFTQPGEPERLGWVVFAGESLRRGKEIVLNLDLGFDSLPMVIRLPG